MKLHFYTIKNDYALYLQSIDKKVPYSSKKKSTRPFVGIVLTIHNINYYAPLSSPKQKHLQMKNQKDFLKIDSGKLGAINFNNMVPIGEDHLKKIDIQNLNTKSKTDLQYKKLLENQLTWCNKNQKQITEKATNLYDLISYNSKDSKLKKRCCDFKKLELALKNYKKE